MILESTKVIVGTSMFCVALAMVLAPSARAEPVVESVEVSELAPPAKITASALDGSVTVNVNGGYDSNVFRLSDSVGPQASLFTEAGIAAGLDYALSSAWSVGVKADGTAQVHESEFSDADSSSHALDLHGEYNPAGRRSMQFSWALEHSMRDSTYVSRVTGQVADIGITPIGDRYDSKKTAAEIKLKMPLSDALRIVVSASAENKDYREDYAAQGLDRLDYRAHEIVPGIEWDRDAHSISLAVPLGIRAYEDRRVSDLNGVAISNSDLEYNYVGVEASWDLAFSRIHSLRTRASWSGRTDNGAGYSDKTEQEIRAGWLGRWRKTDTRASVDLAWSVDEYARLSDAVQQINESAPARRGWSLITTFSAPLASKTLHWFVEARVDSYTNDSNDIYSYDRHQIAAGIKKTFD